MTSPLNDDLLRRPFRTDVPDDIYRFRDAFDLKIARGAAGLLEADEKAELDEDGDGVVSIDDRDEWEDTLIKKYWNFPERLPFNTSLYDPLSCYATRPNAIIVDPLYPGAGTRAQDGINNTITFTDGTPSRNLWSAANTYSIKVIKDLKSTQELGSNDYRWFTRDGSQCWLILRGGLHEQAKEILWLLKNAPALAGKIVVRVMPGETMRWQARNSESSPGVLKIDTMIAATKRVIVRHLEGNGYTEDANGLRTYAVGPFISLGRQTSPFQEHSAAGSWLDGLGLEDNWAISPNHPDAADYPEQVDQAHDNRGIEADTALNGIEIGCDDVTISNSDIRFAPRDFRYRESQAQSGDTIVGTGEGVNVASCSGFTMRRVRLWGTKGHSMFRGNLADDVTLEDCEIENYGHTGILGYGAGGIGGNAWLISGCRVGPFGMLRVWPANGIQLAGFADSVIEDTVVFTSGIGVPMWGVALTRNPLQSDNDVRRNTVRRCVLQGCGFRLAFEAGQNPNNDSISDNAFTNSVIVDRPINNPTQALGGALSYDALVSLNLYRPAENNGWGNTFGNLILWRTDGSTQALSVQYEGSNYTMYGATATFPGWTNNTWESPRLDRLPAATGEWRFNLDAASVARGIVLPAELLLLPLPERRELLHPLLAAVSTDGQTGGGRRSGRRSNRIPLIKDTRPILRPRLPIIGRERGSN